MAKFFRLSDRESTIINRIESSKEHGRRMAVSQLKDCIEPLSNAIATKLIEHQLVETVSKKSLEAQIFKCLEKMGHDTDFDIDYQIGPLRNLVPQPNVVGLYVTAFVIEKLVKHKDIVDVYGADEDIYVCVTTQIKKYVSEKT